MEPLNIMLIAVLLIMNAHWITGAKILAVFPVPSKSHMALNSALIKELAKRGHEVTVVSPFPQEESVPNYFDIKVNLTLEDIFEKTGTTVFDISGAIYPVQVMMTWFIGTLMCEKILQEGNMQNLIHAEGLHFDLVIMEAFINECYIGFAHKFKAPVVQICSYVGSGFIGEIIGNPNNVAYVPDAFQSFTNKMNFLERLQNTLGEIFLMLSRWLFYLPRQEAAMKKYFNYTTDMPDLWDLLTRTSLILVNRHFSVDYPQPALPNMIPVGGMHVKPPKPLPNDLKKFLDEASQGVIYFSMGSAIRSADFPDSKRNAFLEAFSKLNQRVLWKWETDTLPGQPSNVKFGKWLPQSDILAHPNVRVFMMQGGLLSSQESIIRGVPIVGIPIFGDQYLNIARAVERGYGLHLPYGNITSNSITSILKEILENPRYFENVQRLSRIYRDQPLSPLNQAVYWIEYVIRHKGAPHMRSAALDLVWYQYFLLDVISVLVIGFAAIVLIVFLMFRKLILKIMDTSKISKPRTEKIRKKRN